MPPQDPAHGKKEPPAPRRNQGPRSGSPPLDHLRRLYEDMPDAFGAVDMDGRVMFCNQAFGKLLGYSVEELAGMTWQELTPEEYHSVNHRRIEQALQGDDITAPYEKAYLRKDGTTVRVEVRSFPLRDDHGRLTGFAAVVRDITARKSLEQDLRKANAELQREISDQSELLEETRESFRRLSEAALEGIVVSHEGIILDCNERFAAMVGRPIKDLIGKPGLELIDPACQQTVIDRVMASSEETYEINLKRPDGSVFPVEVRARMVRAPNRLIRVTALRDLTEIRRMKSELDERQQGSDELRQLADSLTPREREIVSLVAQGLLNKEIADRLNLALITVKVHRGRAMRKLQASNAAELGQIATLAGIIDPG